MAGTGGRGGGVSSVDGTSYGVLADPGGLGGGGADGRSQRVIDGSRTCHLQHTVKYPVYMDSSQTHRTQQGAPGQFDRSVSLYISDFNKKLE